MPAGPATPHTSPALHAVLAAGTLHTLRLFAKIPFTLLVSACPTFSEFLALPEPALRHLDLECSLNKEAFRAIARLEALKSLRLGPRGGVIGLASLALPVLPMLQHLDLWDC